MYLQVALQSCHLDEEFLHLRLPLAKQTTKFRISTHLVYIVCDQYLTHELCPSPVTSHLNIALCNSYRTKNRSSTCCGRLVHVKKTCSGTQSLTSHFIYHNFAPYYDSRVDDGRRETRQSGLHHLYAHQCSIVTWYNGPGIYVRQINKLPRPFSRVIQ